MITNKQIILGLGLCRLTCMWRLPRPPVTMSRLVVGLVLELLLPCPESALSTTGGLIMALARSSEGLNMALAWSSEGLIMASAWLVGLVIMALACSSDGLIIASTWLVGLVTMASLGLDIMASLLGLVTMASLGLDIMAGLMAGWAWLAGL